MSDTGSTPSHIDASHAQRSKFEQAAYSMALGIVLAASTILLFGVVWPPAPPDTKLADWGAAIVSRMGVAAPVLLTLLGTLGAWVGASLARGAHDAKLGSERE